MLVDEHEVLGAFTGSWAFQTQCCDLIFFEDPWDTTLTQEFFVPVKGPWAKISNKGCVFKILGTTKHHLSPGFVQDPGPHGKNMKDMTLVQDP